MALVFCHGCGGKVHDAAPTCPHCGAPQLQATQVNEVQNSGFMELALMPLKKYADFRGRARRKEYWYFILAAFALNFIIGLVGGVFGHGMASVANFVSSVLSLAFFIPSTAAAVRRMHDTNRSGWWVLLPFVNIVFLCLDSQRGENRFGVGSKYI